MAAQRHPAARRVSSFGVGGTNAHAVLRGSARAGRRRRGRPAAAPPALGAQPEPRWTRRPSGWRASRRATRSCDLADVAFTLHLGRRPFRHRRSRQRSQRRPRPAPSPPSRDAGAARRDRGRRRPPVVFMFPGQGSSTRAWPPGCTRPSRWCASTIDRCCSRAQARPRARPARVLFPCRRARKTPRPSLRDTALAQPALFVVEYALAELWRSWGVQPAAMIGHSVGEYVAATLAGVMTLDDALRLIARRGRLISALPRGLDAGGHGASREAGGRFVDDEVALAAVNAPGLTVLSGPAQAIDAGRAALDARRSWRAPPAHLARLPLLDDGSDPGRVRGLVADVPLSEPALPFVATLTGEWADGAPLTQPAYWSAQLRSTVRFADGLARSGTASPVGKETRSSWRSARDARWPPSPRDRAEPERPDAGMLASLPAPGGRRSGHRRSLTERWGAVGAAGSTVDWEGFHAAERRRRVSLPDLPVRAPELLDRRSRGEPRPCRRPKPRDPSTGSSCRSGARRPGQNRPRRPLDGRAVLIFDEETGLGAAVADRLRAAGGAPVRRHGTARAFAANRRARVRA